MRDNPLTGGETATKRLVAIGLVMIAVMSAGCFGIFGGQAGKTTTSEQTTTSTNDRATEKTTTETQPTVPNTPEPNSTHQTNGSQNQRQSTETKTPIQFSVGEIEQVGRRAES